MKSSDGVGRRVAFVTGATGFVALNLIEALLTGEDWLVYALHRPRSKRARLLSTLLGDTSGSLVAVQGDLLCEKDAFVSLVPPEVDVIFHIAHVKEGSETVNQARVGPQPAGFTLESGRAHRNANLTAMRNVCAAAAARQVRRVVYCSSWSAYGVQPSGTCVDEQTVSTAMERTVVVGVCGTKQAVPYFASKLECEHYLCAELESGRVKQGVILQPCSVFGRFGDEGWCTLFARLLESGGKIPGLPGSSSFCDVQDLAGAFVAAADAGLGRGERYIIGGTNAPSIKMQQIMAELVGVPPPTWAVPPEVMSAVSRWNESLLNLGVALRMMRVMPATIGSPLLVAKLTQDQSAESKAAQSELGYQPRGLREMLQRNYEWLLSSGRLRRKGISRDSESKL